MVGAAGRQRAEHGFGSSWTACRVRQAADRGGERRRRRDRTHDAAALRVVYIAGSARLRAPVRHPRRRARSGQQLPAAGLVGYRHAVELLFESGFIAAERAVDLGIATHLCEPGDLLPRRAGAGRAPGGEAARVDALDQTIAPRHPRRAGGRGASPRRRCLPASRRLAGEHGGRVGLLRKACAGLLQSPAGRPYPVRVCLKTAAARDGCRHQCFDDSKKSVVAAGLCACRGGS